MEPYMWTNKVYSMSQHNVTYISSSSEWKKNYSPNSPQSYRRNPYVLSPIAISVLDLLTWLLSSIFQFQFFFLMINVVVIAEELSSICVK